MHNYKEGKERARVGGREGGRERGRGGERERREREGVERDGVEREGGGGGGVGAIFMMLCTNGGVTSAFLRPVS